MVFSLPAQPFSAGVLWATCSILYYHIPSPPQDEPVSDDAAHAHRVCDTHVLVLPSTHFQPISLPDSILFYILSPFKM